ncbi:quinone oxidoreductase family protein [Nocardia sp. CA-107356]|uniref:quinone oxidoreductase family protein n=1 Tax=Nocardia sp. CA-107356 TaxID=3239972 RepID=UPI003D93AB1F
MSALVGGAGPDWEVRELDVPTAGPGQILVRVRAAGVNRADLYMLDGSYNPNTKTSTVFTAGLEMAGEVEAVGADVRNIAVGDRVGGAGLGAFATYALLDHRHAIAMPADLAWTDAAALPVGLATEHDALVTQGGFTAGQRVLILGGTSAIGLLAVQLAKALGASLVVTTTTSDEKAGALTAVGADVVINTKTENIAEVVSRVTHGAGVDLALDHLGGQVLADSLAATRLGGTIINIGRLAGKQSTLDLDQLSFRRLRLQGTTFSVRTPEELGAVCAALVPDVLPALAAGRIRPVVDRIFHFDEAKAIAEFMRSYQAVGKVVLEIP